MTTAINRRTLLAGAGAMALSATALTACNSGAAPGGGGGGGVLNVWGGVPGENGPDELIKAFMDANPGTQVTYTRYVNDEQGNLKLDTSLSGGVPIDVFFSYSPANLFKRTSAGAALDLTDRIAGDSALSAFTVDADPLSNYVLDGKLFAIPAAFAPQNVYLNKTMMDEAGVTLGPTWTTEEFVETARKLTKPGSVYGSLTSPPLARPTLGPDYLYADGGSRSNFENAAFRSDIELALKLQTDGVIMPREAILAEKLQTFSQTPFIAGRVAMLVQSGHITRSINDTKQYPHDFATYCMPIPVPDGVEEGWNTGQIGDLMSINPKSRNVDGAWAFVQFWMQNAGKYMAKGGRLPSIVGETTPDEIVAQMLGAERDTLYDVASWQSFLFDSDFKLPVDTIFTAATELTTIQTKLSDEAMLGSKTVDAYISELTSQADAAIKGAA